MKNSVLSTTIIGMLLIAFISCNQKDIKKTEAQTSKDTVTVSAPLPSWNESLTREAIISYTEEVTDSSNDSFIPVADRIVTIDNDGTLWSEQPVYFQFFYAIERVKKLAPEHPEWKNQQPFKAVLENDMPALMKQGEKGLLQIVMTTHAGITTDEFEALVKEWISTAKHPTKNQAFTELVFQPMLELMDYLKANNFKVFIVSGGGIEFMRPWVEEVYGVSKDHVVGSSIKTVYDYNNGSPVIKKLPEIDLIDDKGGKPIGINRYIGRKPVISIGNSDGDLEMMHWTEASDYKTLKVYIHHTDAEREWAYDSTSHIGTLKKGLIEAQEKGWIIVDMKNDWKVIYPFEKE